MVLIRKDEAVELFDKIQFAAHVSLIPLALYLSLSSPCCLPSITSSSLQDHLACTLLL
jgi:hypothetical protein